MLISSRTNDDFDMLEEAKAVYKGIYKGLWDQILKQNDTKNCGSIENNSCKKRKKQGGGDHTGNISKKGSGK